MIFEALRKLFEGLLSIVIEAVDMERKGEEERTVSGIRAVWLLGLIPLEEKYEYKITLLTSYANNMLHAPKRSPRW